MNENKKKISVLIISVCLVLVLIVGISYAYFSRSGASNDRTVQAGTLRIQYADDNTNTVVLNNIAPIYDVDIQTKANKIGFTVTNTGTSKAYVEINLTDISMDSELSDLEFKWAIYSGNTKVANGNLANVTNNKQLLTNNIELNSGASNDYQLYIWISESEKNQSELMNKTFSAKLQINGTQEEQPKLLSKKIIEDNSPVVTTTPNFGTTATTDEGLIKGTDADGDTYYFRGDVEDNYLFLPGYSSEKTYKPCVGQYYAQGYPNNKNRDKNSVINACNQGMWQAGGYPNAQACIDDIVCTEYSDEEIIEKVNLFRIVRINGSGTTRIIANDIIGNTAYNTNGINSDTKYTGYTYTENGEEKDSTIKGVIDNWYTTKMSSLDSYIAEERFCSDTSGTSEEYGALSRLKTDNGHIPEPIFICPTTDKDYGGEYRLKVGLITADEIAFAGGLYLNSNSNFYLKKINEITQSTFLWSGSPDFSRTVFILDRFGLGNILSNWNGLVAPVLNLKSNVLYSSGSGTKTDPYVISQN